MQFSTALVAAFAAYATALPSSAHILHEKRHSLTSDWSRHEPAPADVVLPMRVALKQQNLEQVSQLLDEVSNPRSKHFGKHWTGEQLAHKFAPSSNSIATVKKWLAEAGLKSKVAANRGWVEFDATVAQAEALMKTRYHVYTRTGEHREHVGCDGYSVPEHVSEHIDFITPTVSMSGELRRSIGRRQQGSEGSAASGRRTKFTPVDESVVQNLHTGAELANSAPQLANVKVAGPAINISSEAPSVATCAQGVTPACMRAMYSIPKGNTSTMGNPLGVYESEDYFDQADLDIFFSQFAPDIENGTAPMLNSINGGLGPDANSSVSGESVLDLEVAYALIAPQGVRLLQVDDPTYATGTKRGHFDSLLDALDASFCSFMGGDDNQTDPTYPNAAPGGYNGTKMCGDYEPPTVLSISYGYPETFFSPAYITRQCLEFAKLGLSGTTVVVSSGDSGVSAPFCTNPKIRTSTPQFPASCPYVTTVGSTMLNPNVTELSDPQAELAAHRGEDYQSGGGFSNTFAQPSYQADAVSNYLAQYYSTLGNATMVRDVQYNSSGRAYPDVAAIGMNITTITNGKVFNADGTSASAPLFASLVTLVNELRAGEGKGPVGFINPLLYGGQNVFKDITAGPANGGCGMPGFSAMQGWDPVTGLGTPQWETIRELLVNAP